MTKRSSLTARNSSIQAAMVAASGQETAPLKSRSKEASKASEAKAVGLSVRLTADTHEALRRIAFDRRVSIHSLLLEGVDFVIQKHG